MKKCHIRDNKIDNMASNDIANARDTENRDKPPPHNVTAELDRVDVVLQADVHDPPEDDSIVSYDEFVPDVALEHDASLQPSISLN